MTNGVFNKNKVKDSNVEDLQNLRFLLANTIYFDKIYYLSSYILQIIFKYKWFLKKSNKNKIGRKQLHE